MFNFFRKSKSVHNLQPIDRVFNQKYFKDVKANQEIETQGYTVLKNVVDAETLTFLSDTFSKLQQFPEYKINEAFQNSGRFQSAEIRSFVMNAIGEFSKKWLPEQFDEAVYDDQTTGAFQIKPPSKKSALNPHQDSPVIDETSYNALFVWIPLIDINSNNGPVYVLPKSHLWGNHQRSLNVPWVFEKHTKTLWKHMQPICVNKGDILCWDAALIHSSSPNLSDQTRIALTTTLLPNNFKMVDFFKHETNGKIEKYQVEKSFWESGDIMRRPPVPPNKLLASEVSSFPEKISKKELVALIKA